MEQAGGYVQKEHKHKVYKLQNTLYGLNEGFDKCEVCTKKKEVLRSNLKVYV